MEPVSGFMSFDGNFFTSPEACRVYEERLNYRFRLEERSKAVFKRCSTGSFGTIDPLPPSLQEHMTAISKADLRSMWDAYLHPLFVDPGCSFETLKEDFTAVEEAAYWDFLELRTETAYKLLAFVLGKPV